MADYDRQKQHGDSGDDGTDGAHSADLSDFSSGSALKGPDSSWCPPCCTAACFCHFCYVALFLCYVVVFPLWCKWLLTAPMPFGYWGEGYPDFPRMPLAKSGIAMQNPGGEPQILMSPIPDAESACNYTCGEELHGFRTSEVNFQVDLRLNKGDLDENAHSTYPVLLASEDFKNWMLVADRRNAYPSPFFSAVEEKTSRTYISQQANCTRPPIQAAPAAPVSLIAPAEEPPSGSPLTSGPTYVIACVTWTATPGLRNQDTLSAEEVSLYCEVIGGVCGWTCGSRLDPTILEHCNSDGVIERQTLRDLVPGKPDIGNVTIEACKNVDDKECSTLTEGFSSWPCHKCIIRWSDDELMLRRRLLGLPGMPPGMEPPGMDDGVTNPSLPSLSDIGGGAGGGFDDEEDEEGEEGGTDSKTYRSLPRLLVKYHHAQAPRRLNISSAPHAYILSSTSLQGPWTKVYAPVEVDGDWRPPVPVAQPKSKDPPPRIMGDEKTAMKLQPKNHVSIEPSSCYGKRGPMYLVACAVNQSLYDDKSQWKNNKEQRFNPGQKVMPPPFNDRCVAVSGRCGHACEHNKEPIAHCSADGHILHSALVDEIHIKFNRTAPVFCFAYVLLFGFAVKTVMLCPGIFSPYKRCHFYDPDLTEQLRYILVVGVTGGGDEGKGTMVRNTIGMCSGLPPECRCRFIVCNNEEGHRLEMMHCWEKLCAVLHSIPHQGGYSYEDNLRKFLHVWCDETREMRLGQVGGKVKQLDPKILARLSGKTTLEKVRKSMDWGKFGAAFDKLAAAVDALNSDLDNNYNKFSPMTPHLDYVRDWVPPDPRSTSLRMHFTSRAKPQEDPRNIMVQHVAVGTWYYKVPPQATPRQLLDLRKNCQEMVYSQPDEDEVNVKVPLRSSHGKAGGLNFVDNYITIVNDRPENHYGTDQDDATSLYAIADARHQYQPDFFISCLPCFFNVDGSINQRVAFTQAPQHYPEYADKYDYLDNNNAQFFRLNAMIRNCCGGVSSCGTNGMWQLPSRDNSTIWQWRLKRVRDRDQRLRKELIEREQFHTSCKIEDTASSLDRVLVGEYSHFVNRKLSYGMSKDPEGFLGAQQRWVEGAITLCLQWVTRNADAHGKAKTNQPLLWLVIIGFILYVWSLLRLVTKQYTSSIFVEFGLLSPETFDQMIRIPLGPPIRLVYESLMAIRGGHSPNSYSYEVYENMTMQFIVFMTTCVFMFFMLWLVTNFCRCFKKCCTLPYEMKWWGRLVISFDNLTYWVWFWTSFFWIGFNVYLAVIPASFHFNNIGMMSFMLVATFLNYALIIANSMRFSVMESIDANEIAFLSMDNIWRANQLFFMVGPIQAFSVFTGTKNFISYLMYGQDIGGWAGGDLTQTSIAIVKFWTTSIILASIGCWIYLFASDPSPDEYQSRRPGCIIFSFIAMDVLHPCVYLWTVGGHISPEETRKMTWLQRLSDTRWWKKFWSDVMLNTFTTNIFRYVAPVYNFMLPILVFYNSYYGVSAGFTLVAVGAGH